MKIISSHTKTVFNKRVFPVFWYGGLLLFLGLVIYGRMWSETPLLVIIPVFMMIFGAVWLKSSVFLMVDSVFDCGDYLLVKKGKISTRIEINEIAYVDEHILSYPHTVTLKLKNPSQLGCDIVFCPSFDTSLNPFDELAVTKSLSKRVNAWRRGG